MHLLDVTPFRPVMEFDPTSLKLRDIQANTPTVAHGGWSLPSLGCSFKAHCNKFTLIR